MIREVIPATEGVPVQVPAAFYEELALEGERVAVELRLRFGGVTRLSRALIFKNMIGTIATSRIALEIAPKTNPNEAWLPSVLDLMDEQSASFTEDLPASESANRATFVDVLARIYSKRLNWALSTEGPITTIKSEYVRSNMLSGRLGVEEWIKRAAYDGHRFPVHRQTLSVHNAYALTLSYVGTLLAQHIRDANIRRQLEDAAVELSGGRDVLMAPPNAIGLELPDQWGSYIPAWTIAQMILKQRSRFGHHPQPYGMSIVIEPWMLLERLLERSLLKCTKLLNDGPTFSFRRQNSIPFLSGTMRDDTRRYLRPDCVLLRDGVPLVNFEAKYRDYQQTGAPSRSESYQAITAGRALGSALAVLVYPNDHRPERFCIRKTGHPPEELAIVGLDLFRYRRGAGDTERAELLAALLKDAKGTRTMLKGGLAA